MPVALALAPGGVGCCPSLPLASDSTRHKRWGWVWDGILASALALDVDAMRPKTKSRRLPYSSCGNLYVPGSMTFYGSVVSDSLVSVAQCTKHSFRSIISDVSEA